MKCVSGTSFSQATSQVRALQRSEGLEFKKVFSAGDVSAAIAEARPDFRDRAFSPCGHTVCLYASGFACRQIHARGDHAGQLRQACSR